MAHVSRSATQVKGFENPEEDFQLLRLLGSAVYGGASVGQCLEMARQINDGAPAVWVKTFADLAAGLEADALRRLEKGRTVSARDQFLAASNAYRQAEYFTAVDAPSHAALGLKSRECLQRALPLTPSRSDYFFVAHESAALPACFLAPDGDALPRPTLIAVSGYDGTIEETFLQIGLAALERGFNVCLFAGPGQMDTLRFAPGSSFEPDYERPVSLLLDTLLSRPEVDPSRVALYGISIGGYFAPRAVSGEPRISALAANSPVVDYFSYMCGILGFDPLKGGEDFSIADLPEIPDAELPPHLKHASRSLMLRFGQPSFKAVFERLKDFSLEGRLRDITCPCLAMAGEGEGEEVQRQLDAFCSGVSGEVARRVFTQREGADAHCQVGNLRLAAAELMDWLEEVFQVQRGI